MRAPGLVRHYGDIEAVRGTYVMEALRSLILADLVWSKIACGIGVVAVLLALTIMLNVRAIQRYD